jgi:hypothetical protein
VRDKNIGMCGDAQEIFVPSLSKRRVRCCVARIVFWVGVGRFRSTCVGRFVRSHSIGWRRCMSDREGTSISKANPG